MYIDIHIYICAYKWGFAYPWMSIQSPGLARPACASVTR